MSELSRLASDYFDGALQPDDDRKLRDFLLQSRQSVDDFVVDCFVHTQLIELLGPHQTHANSLVAAESLPKPLPTKKPRSIIGRALFLAASVAFLFGLSFFALSRPNVVATVSGTRDVKWGKGIEKRTVGSLMESGDQVAIDSGIVYMTFARGGQVALHGPVQFRVDSDYEGRLIRGRLSVFVPEHAVGFTIRADKISIVDLGTEYHAELAADGSCTVQVFDGLVDIKFDSSSKEVDDMMPVPAGRAYRFGAASDTVQSIDYDESVRLPKSIWSE